MLSFTKKTDYALIALAYLAQREGMVSSAREIAEAHDLPLALLMKILKGLHQQGIVKSARGTNGGYKLNTDLQLLSLHDLICMLEPDQFAAWARRLETPLLALHYKLISFLRDVKLSDLVLPGRRIDVPLEAVRFCERKKLENPSPVSSGDVTLTGIL